MTLPKLTLWAIGGGFAAVLCASATLEAQSDTTRRDTTRARSTQRIPIRKESQGTVVPTTTQAQRDSIARADSVTRASQARNDSIMAAERARMDSIAAAERARADAMRADSLANAARRDSLARAEQARADSISRAEASRTDSITRVDPAAGAAIVNEQNMSTSSSRSLGSFYYGLAVGAANPISDVEDLGYGTGLNISVPLGWHNPSSLFGIRLLLGYSQFTGENFTIGGPTPVVLNNADTKVYSGELTLNMRFPFNEQKTSAIYLLGGGGLYMFSNFGEGSALGAYLGNDVLDPDDEANESTITKFGVSGGAGVEFGIGRSSLFLESRIVNAYTGRDDSPSFDNAFGSRGTTVRWIPLILGVTIR